MQHILITGSNRGIGLAITKAYLEQGDAHIIATCRTPDNADALQELRDLHPSDLTILPLDVSDQSSIDECFGTVDSTFEALDVLINNAGINPDGQSLDDVDFDVMAKVLHVNSAAPLMVTKAALPLLEQSENPRIVNISSSMGSLSQTTSGGAYAYRASKAALNMVTRTLAADLGDTDITVLTLDPGWVQTDMGGSNANLEAPESAAGIVEVANGLTSDNHGAFLRWNGDTFAW